MVETRLDELSWLFCIVARVFLVIADFFFSLQNRILQYVQYCAPYCWIGESLEIEIID